MPTLLSHPPRLVELATSGLTVTTRSATSGASRTRSAKKRPNACWVDSWPRCAPSCAGTGGGATGSGSSRAAQPRRGAQLALGAARIEGRPGLVGVGVERLRQLQHLLSRQQRRVVLRVPSIGSASP